ncbi:MAG: PAS domain S-box protein [Spirochaetales bacterium]|nr:PAS domain S-box protein [Spirochaetales bacterium]
MKSIQGIPVLTSNIVLSSVLGVLIAFVMAFVILKHKEQEEYKRLNPSIEFIIGRKEKLFFINKASINFFGFNTLSQKEIKDEIKRWVEQNSPNIYRASHEKFEYSKDGRTILFTKVIDLVNHNIFFFGTDITDQKNSEVKIRRLLAAIEQSANSVLITDSDGSINYVNKAFERFTGYRQNEVIGKTPAILKSGYHDNCFYDNLWETILSGSVWNGTFMNKRKDGEMYWENTTITPICGSNGDIFSYIALKEDITLKKQMEQELRLAKDEAERSNKLKSDFLANISHEIRTPLNGILGFTDVILCNETDDENREMLRLILKSGRDLLELINEVLDLSKIEADRIEIESYPFSLCEMLLLLEKQFSVFAGEKSLKLEFHTPGNMPPRLTGGEKQIKQILNNLIGNALKFTEKGFVRVVTGYENGILQISVTDSGMGMSEEQQLRVFDAFQQAGPMINNKYKGTGLGLTISRRLARLMAGDITVQSVENKGASFTLRIPLLPGSLQDEAEYSELIPVEGELVDIDSEVPAVIVKDRLPGFVAEKPKTPPRLLTVCDEEVSFQRLEEINQAHGMSTELVADAVSAFRMLDENEYDILLMDTRSTRIGDRELISIIRERSEYDNLYVIIITEDVSPDAEKRYLSMGYDYYLSKPIDHNRIMIHINLFLKRYEDSELRRYIYDTSELHSSELKKLEIELRRLKRIVIDDDFDDILTVTEEIAGISQKDVVQEISADLREIWEIIDETALTEFILNTQDIYAHTAEVRDVE